MAAGGFDTSSLGEIHDAQMDYYGQRTAVASGDACVYIFEADGQKSPSAVLKGHEGPVWKVAWAHPKFAMNRSGVVASCGYDMKVIIWRETNPSQWQIAHCDTAHSASVNSIQFCPWELGLKLACASSDGTVSVLTHSPNDQQWHRVNFQAHASGVMDLAWDSSTVSSSGSIQMARLVTGGCDSAVKVWSCLSEHWSQEQPPMPIGHTDWVKAVAWRPDNVRVLASGGDKTVIIWEQERDSEGPWRQLTKLSLPEKIEALSWSETGGVLAVSTGDGDSALYKESGGGGTYVEIAKVNEIGLQDVPNSLVSGIAEPQATGPKVSLETIVPGDGKTFPKTGDMLSMHYTGKIASSGVKFDSSLDRGTPFEFQIGLGKVIDGWDQGVIQMSLGQKALLKVPYALGYGDEGAGGVIPPKADLLFEVELLKIN